MEQPTLNLARKWRSAQFKEIVGQDLVVRILQNSLFKNQFFPVYLFSGQRGCGKTSTARVFASALNCQKLSAFQLDPKIQMPCLTCSSCIAMTSGRHPDFIEIDAASYTGVDNIRNIIDTSSFLPLLGERKIYLIDEVHMLSKAAFNAFLKILEEPPKFVVFILATTEAQKLPDTVRSRCFQLFFNPVNLQTVTLHLENMCKEESISYEIDGLEMIARVTQGSLRDAINLLEQARFADSKVTKSVVLSVLGYLDDATICSMLQSILEKDHVSLAKLFSSWSGQIVSMDYLVKRSIEILYDLVVVKYGGVAKYAETMSDSLTHLVDQVSIQSLIDLFDELCSVDMVMAKTGKKQLLFESLMLRLCLNAQLHRQNVENQSISVNTEHHDSAHDEKKNNVNIKEEKNNGSVQWDMFVKVVVAHVDPVLASMLYATQFLQFDSDKNIVRVATLKKFVLFQDLFIDQKKFYQEYLDRVFGFKTVLVVEFTNVSEPKKVVEKVIEAKKVENGTVVQKDEIIKHQNAANQKTFDSSDPKKWKITNALLEHFGGTVKEIIKEKHEFDA